MRVRPCRTRRRVAPLGDDKNLERNGDIFQRTHSSSEGWCGRGEGSADSSACASFPSTFISGIRAVWAAGSRPLAHLARVDALRLLFRSFPVSKAKVLVEQGALAVGMMLRDADVLHKLLVSLSQRDGFGRRSLVLALGLLGRVVDVEQAVPDPERADDTAAWVLATVLADAMSAHERIRHADRQARFGARKVTCACAADGYPSVER